MSDQLTHAQAVNRCKEIEAELEQLRTKKSKTGEDHERVPKLLEEFRRVNTHRLDLEHDAALTEVREAFSAGQTDAESTRGDVEGEPPAREEVRTAQTATGTPRPSSSGKRFRDPWNLSEVRTFGRDQQAVGSELRSRALDAIERMPHATDAVRAASADLIERFDDSNSRLAKLALATSSPDYMRAFTKLVRSQGQMATLNQDEIGAYQRAMSLTDSAGGYLIPFQLDPTVILTANGSRNRIRSIARVVTATGDVWSGVSSAGVTGSWDAEAAEVSDDAPTFAQPTVPVYKGSIFVPISIEANEDESNVAGEIARMVAFEKDRMESVAFTTGSGSGEPTGIVTALIASSPSVLINSATADTFAVGDIYALDGALPARYADNASWLAHRSIYNLVRRFDTAGGANLWETLGNGLPPELLGRPAVTSESMDGVVNATQENYVSVFGDFSNYVIADRIGTTIEYIPHLFGTNRRPTGQRGWYAYFRVGADSVNDAAFRMLNVT